MPKRHWYAPRTWQRNIPLPPRKKLPSTAVLIRHTVMMLAKNWKTFFGIALVYGIGIFIFVKSFSVGTALSQSSGGGVLTTTIVRFGSMISDAASSMNAASGIYQIIVSTICSLALIWYFRQVLSAEKTSVKQCFYEGMRPLVPYLLVLAMLGIHLIPLALGGYLLSLMQSSYLLFGWEMFVAWGVFLLLAIWSLRMLTHSIFALFAVTLPRVTPLQALRSAKKIVYRRRLIIWRKILLAVVLFALVSLVLVTPFLLWLPAVAPWIFFLFTVSIAMFGQAYLYTIYRELL